MSFCRVKISSSGANWMNGARVWPSDMACCSSCSSAGSLYFLAERHAACLEMLGGRALKKIDWKLNTSPSQTGLQQSKNKQTNKKNKQTNKQPNETNKRICRDHPMGVSCLEVHVRVLQSILSGDRGMIQGFSTSKHPTKTVWNIRNTMKHYDTHHNPRPSGRQFGSIWALRPADCLPRPPFFDFKIQVRPRLKAGGSKSSTFTGPKGGVSATSTAAVGSASAASTAASASSSSGTSSWAWRGSL